MNYPAASSGYRTYVVMPDLIRHPVRLFWIPASAGMTDARQAAGNGPEGIQSSNIY